jgi:excisionase family DNA binding protein
MPKRRNHMQVPEHNIPIDLQLLPVTEAAKILNLSERQVRKFIAEKKIGIVRIGRRISIAMSELQEFVKEHTEA